MVKDVLVGMGRLASLFETMGMIIQYNHTKGGDISGDASMERPIIQMILLLGDREAIRDLVTSYIKVP